MHHRGGISRASAADVIVIPSNDLTTLQSASKLDISTATYSGCEWQDCNGKVLTEYDSYGSPSIKFCVPIPSASFPVSYSDFLTIHFTGVGNIAGRSLDIDIHIDAASISDVKWSDNGYLNPDGYATVVILYPVGTHLNYYGYHDPAMHGYVANKSIQATVTIRWSDTKQVVDLPFYQVVNDIDTYIGSNGQIPEAWEGKSGYDNRMYVWHDCNMDIDGMKVTSRTDSFTIGDEEYLKCGLVASMPRGQATMVYEGADCEGGISLYSTYTNLKTPSKSVT